MTLTKTIYFDESGSTGRNLLDPKQPFFSIGSTDLTEAESSEILRRHFPTYIGKDIKFMNLFRPNNYRSFIEFSETIGQQPARFFSFLVDKRFALLCRLIDWFVEPLFRKHGYSWYKDDYGLSWANLFYLGFKTQNDDDALLIEITGLYSNFVREPSPVSFAKMKHCYRNVADAGPENVSRFMEYVAEGVDRFEELTNHEEIRNQTDIHVASVVSAVSWWRSQHDMDFDIIHDQSTYFFKRKDLWDIVTSKSASKAIVRVGKKSIQFPLRVNSTTEGLSENSPSLQICDLIGGFVARSRAHNLADKQKITVDKMIEVGFNKIGFDCVEPGSFYAKGLPPLADGPDAVDQIAIAVR